MATGSPFHIVDFSEIPPVPCPCGVSRRAFADVPDYPATIHLTDITLEAQTHYHLRQTEAYYILECAPCAALEMNGEVIPLKPGMCVLIPPGVRHRGVGQMRILNIVIPKFDAADEYLEG